MSAETKQCPNPSRRKSQTVCLCTPKCSICGWGEHMAIHQSGYIGKPSDPVYFHEFSPTNTGEEE